MATDIRYNVIAQMGVRGWQGMRGMARALKPVWNNIAAIEQRMASMGKALKGSMGETAATWGARGAMAGAIALPTALGAAAAYGLRFNNTMEQANLQAATMYNLFDFAANAAEVANGELSQWEYNLQASKAVFKELYDIAEKTPGSFQDVAIVYQNAASGLATQTQDLRRHLEFMEKASLLGGLTGGRYDVLGAQMGRILSGSAGAEMDVWKNLSLPLLKAGQAMKDASGNPIFGKDLKAGEELTLAFNKLAGDTRLELMMRAMEKIGPEVADAWGNSMDGMIGTTTSAMQTLSGRVTKPLFEAFRVFLKRLNSTVLGKDTSYRWNNFADQVGAKLGKYAEVWFSRVIEAGEFIRDNWVDIMAYAKNAGIIIAGAIKGAFAFGIARWIAGTAFLAGGKMAGAVKGAKEFANKLKPIFERQARMTHAAIVRGAHGKRGGILGKLGELLGARTNRMARESRSSSTFRERFRRGKDGKFKGGKEGGGMVTRLQGALGADPFRNIAVWMAKFASLGMVLAGGAIAAGLLIAAFGIVFTLVGGVAAYIVSNWETISRSLAEGLRNGTITLQPLLTAAYTFWERLKLIGVWLLGSSNHGEQFNTVLGWVTSAFGMASTAISFFLRAMAFFLGIWYTLKLAMLGVARAILWIIDMSSYLPGVGASTETQIQAGKNYEAFAASVDATAQSGAELLAMADKIDKFQLSALQMENITKESDAMAKSLADMLAGKGTKEDKRKTSGAKVHVEKMDVKVDLRDEDPDRMMSMFLTPLMRLAEHRTQSGMLPAGGV